jgi:16S rRNA processing protein RimM
VTNEKVLITVGIISKPHNLSGAVKVLPITDFPERFLDRQEILVEVMDKLELMKISSISLHNGFLIMQLKDIDSIEKAEQLKGAYLKISGAQLAPLDENEFYIFQLIDMKVKDIQGNYIGKLVEVIKTGANDVYVVKNQANKEILIPALKKVIKKIDLEAKEMIVELLPELK